MSRVMGMHRVHDTSLQVVHACINRKRALSYHVGIKFQILYHSISHVRTVVVSQHEICKRKVDGGITLILIVLVMQLS